MNDAERASEARRSLRYAWSDLQMARLFSVGQRPPSPILCWHAHQCAEKVLKAALVFLEIEVPFTHDLNRLRRLLPEDWGVRTELPSLARLTVWAIEARYPGDWPDATLDDAREALADAESVWRAVLQDLAREGLTFEPHEMQWPRAPARVLHPRRLVTSAY